MSSPVHERLRKLLFLVPYVAKHPGITIDELAKAIGSKREALLEDLELLPLVGRPPFQPDDYIDLHVENDRIYVDLDQRLSKPPRFTAAEAAALSAAAELLRPAAGDALASALGKLEKVLPPTIRERSREMGRKIDAQLDAPSELGPVARAITEHRELEFDYFTGNRGSTERRVVRPAELFSNRGQWYLEAHDVARNDTRLFRLDRMNALAVSDRTFTPAPTTAPSKGIPNPLDARGQVRVRFSKAAARLVRERFGDDAELLADGGVEVKVAVDSERWVTQWVLSFGGEAEVIAPPQMREAVARAARASLES